MPTFSKIGWHWLAAIVLVGLDQLTKLLASKSLSMLEAVTVIPSAFSLQLVHNYGAAYGILQHQRPLLLGIGLSVLISCVVFRRYIVPTPLSRWGLAILFAGTLGNWLDRFRLHYVVDFIDIRIFPVFNLADVMIDIGLALFVLDMILDWRKNRRKSPAAG